MFIHLFIDIYELIPEQGPSMNSRTCYYVTDIQIWVIKVVSCVGHLCHTSLELPCVCHVLRRGGAASEQASMLLLLCC